MASSSTGNGSGSGTTRIGYDDASFSASRIWIVAMRSVPTIIAGSAW
jgi:hypothetical protein